MNYEVIREDKSRLTRQRWRFWVDGTRVILDQFRRESRPTTRHKYGSERGDRYGRIDARDALLPVHMVPQPRDVRIEVLQQIIADLQVFLRDRRGVEAPFAPGPPVVFQGPTIESLEARGLVKAGRVTAAGRKALGCK